MTETRKQERLNTMSRNGAFGSPAPIRPQARVEAPPAKRKIARTSAGLRDALFDAIEKVSVGDITPGDAHAMANLANQICKTVHLEIEVARLRTEYPADAKLIVPSPLQLGVAEVSGDDSKVP